MIDRCDFQFSTRGRLNTLGYFHHLIGIKIKTHNGIIGLRDLRFLFDAENIPGPVKLSYTIAFGITYPITKNSCFVLRFGCMDCFTQHTGKTLPIKDIITKNQTYRIIAYKLLTNNKCLCQAVGRRLLGVLKTYSKVRTVTQQTLKAG